jgi:hypothetical protein
LANIAPRHFLSKLSRKHYLCPNFIFLGQY